MRAGLILGIDLINDYDDLELDINGYYRLLCCVDLNAQPYD